MMSKEKESFSFNEKNIKEAQDIIAKYPKNRQKSAVLPLLNMAQKQNGGWLSVPAIEHVAEFISEPYMRVYEVVSFYSMFNLKPVGKYHIQVCGTTPCWLHGADKIMQSCEKYAKVKCGNTSEDGLFTISEVECLGACVDAPVVQINDDYHEQLDDKKIANLIEKLKTS